MATGIQVEKRLRGVTAGFNTPTFVVDARREVASEMPTALSITTGRRESVSTPPLGQAGQFSPTTRCVAWLPMYRRPGRTPPSVTR